MHNERTRQEGDFAMTISRAGASPWARAFGLAAIGLSSSLAHAAVTTFYGEASRASWLAQSGGAPTTIDFAGLPIGSQVTDQYVSQGVFFDQAGTADYQPGYRSDGWVQWNHHGYYTNPIQADDGMRATFESPMRAIAMDHLTLSTQLQLTLYLGENVIWSGTLGGWEQGYEWPWSFGGIVSDQAFDRVWVTSTQVPQGSTPGGGPNFVILNTLMFSPVPGPGAAVLFAIGAAARPRSRRR